MQRRKCFKTNAFFSDRAAAQIGLVNRRDSANAVAMENFPRIGLALGGGGVRGLAHVPVLQTLDARGLSPVCLAGTSMGALIGVMYAAGWSGDRIRSELECYIGSNADGFRDLLRKRGGLWPWLRALRPTWNPRGLVKVDGLLRRFLAEIGVETFADLRIPLRVVATDFLKGEPVVFTEGPLLPALQASISIPGVFEPLSHAGRLLVDGGLVNNVPYDLVREDANCVVAVDVSPVRKLRPGEAPHLLDAGLWMFDLLVDQRMADKLERQPPDVYLRPEFTDVRILEFDRAREALAAGEAAMPDFIERLSARFPPPEGGPA
jgi:NTE family protein